MQKNTFNCCRVILCVVQYAHLKPRTQEKVFRPKSLMKMCETDVKTDRPYSFTIKVADENA